MKIDKNSLAFRLLVPALITIVAITCGMFLAGEQILHKIVDDYHHFLARSQAEETRRLYDAALAEMTTARLLDNPAVVEAKKEILVESTGLDWKRRGVGGIIVGPDGKVLLTTLSPALTARMVGLFGQGFIDLHTDSRVFFGQVEQFHPWGWKIITVVETLESELADTNASLMIPLLIIGPLLMLAAMLMILRQLRWPMTMLVSAVSREEEVAVTGVTEFDTIGGAYNLGLGRIKERTGALIRELAERKAAEELIRQKEARIRLLLHSTSEGIYGVDTEGKCTFCNPSCCSLLGYSEEELLGRNIHALVHYAFADGSPYPEADCRAYRAFRDGLESHEGTEVFWRADGSSFPVEYWAHPVIENGITVGAVVTFFDITDRRESDERLQAAWQEWQNTFDSATDLITLLSPEGVIRQVNHAFAEFCGRDAKELIGENCFKIVHGTGDHIDECPLVRARQSRHREEMELSIGARTFSVVVDPVLDQDGRFVGAVHIMHDISGHKQLEDALRAEKNKFEAVIAGLGDGLSIQDLDFTILYQNQVHQGFTGSHVGESCFAAYQHKEAVCEGCPLALSFADGGVHTVERRVERPGGSRYFEITTSALRDGAGVIIGGIELVRDVTERKRAEEQLFHAQKMEGIGHLAGGVAHDFNNVLNVIQGYSDLLRLKAPREGGLGNYIDQISAAVQRGSTITRQILAFSRKGVMSIQTVNLNELIAALQIMLRRLVREDIEMQVYLSEETLFVDVDPGQIDQVLINLATNACDAMSDGGRLRIETGQVVLDDAFIRLHGYGTPGEYAMFTVSDTGTGMQEAVRKRIFEPFYTTKKVGEGTGLGLSMVYGIVRKHNGYINVYSEPGHGTVFRIYLPRTAGAMARKLDYGAVPAAGLIQGGTETILVAEDDPSLREWARIMLEMYGYKVVEATDGADAVDKFTARKDSIDLVLLDGIMPTMNGRQALVEMRKVQPGVKAIILSGYAEDVFTQADLQNLKAIFVQKPVVPNQLLITIRQVLDEGRGD